MSPLIIGIVILAVVLIAFLLWRRYADKQKSQLAPTQHGIELVCVGGTIAGQRYPMEQTLSIGRDPQNHIVIDSEGASRFHALVQLTSSGLMLQDLDSTNGTYVWDAELGSWERILILPLQFNQVFQIGTCQFAPTSTSPVQAPAVVNPSPPVTPPAQRTNIVVDVSIHDFQLGNKIGEGGAATVFFGERISDKKRVAVKKLHNRVDNYFQRKFEHEIEISKRLQSHPHIVPIVGIAQEEGSSYIIMEYMEHGSLRGLMNTQRIGPQRAIQIIGDVCLALDYAHSLEIYHRDLKPENILFDNNNITYLADFGIARLTSLPNVTQEGMIVGTPDYMSYEQAAGDKVDGRSDQYALAIVLFELLTGSCPFQGRATEVVRQHLQEKPPSPRSRNQDISQDVSNAILKALEKDRENRFTRMSDFAEAIGYEGSSAVRRQSDVLSQQVVVHHQVYLVDPHSNTAVITLDPAQPLEIGRDQLPYEGVSRQHAVVWFQNGHFYIQDVGSRNGTYINQQRVTSTERLDAGMLLQIGSVQLQIVRQTIQGGVSA